MNGARLAFAALSVVFSGCSAPATDGDDPDSIFTSEAGELQATVSSEPASKPERGSNQIFYRIESVTTGDPVDHLELSMTPFMPGHGHASSTRLSAVALGEGVYRFDDVVFFMPGVWELRTTVSGESSDLLAPRFEIE